jgi:plastocyanin
MLGGRSRACREGKEIQVVRTFSIVAIAAVSLTLAACGSKASSKPATSGNTAGNSGGNSLVGTVGPGFTISLTKGGSSVSTLKAGTYTITVSDKSSMHNFHLFGPGVEQKTDVGATGTSNWTVTFKKGSYTYQCDAHFRSGMIEHFTVT